MYKEPKSEVTNMTPMNIVCHSTGNGGGTSELQGGDPIDNKIISQ